MFFETFGETLHELLKPIFTIGLVLGFAFIANYSGISSTLGLAFAATGALFPFFSPFLGWLGVFLTGSDTSSNALFANLQAVTAQQIGVNPILTIAANTTGGVTGKMISPQSIAVACAAVGSGRQGVRSVPLHREAQPVLRDADRHHHLHPGLHTAVDDSSRGAALIVPFTVR